MNNLILLFKYVAIAHLLFIVVLYFVFLIQLTITKMNLFTKIKSVFRFTLISLPTWIFYLASTVPLYILGWVMIPLAAACKAYERTNDINEWGIYHFTWPIMKVWDNWEDGIANNNYWVAPNLFLQIVYWSAYRNPINGLRTTPVFSLMIKSTKVRFIGSFGNSTYYKKLVNKKQPVGKLLWYDEKIPQWFFAWQGLYSNFYWQFVMPFTISLPFIGGYNQGDLLRAWIGWKIYPDDIMGKPLGYRKHGAGFGLQFKRILKGG